MKGTNPRAVWPAERTSFKPPEKQQRAEKIITGEVLSWAEVNRTHRTRNGIYHRHESLISLLTDFGRINACYPDRMDDSGEVIHYTGEGRRGDQRLSPGNRALLAAIEMKHSVPLFSKLAPGLWRHTGLWRVTSAEHRFDERENRMLWWFTLRSVTSDNP